MYNIVQPYHSISIYISLNHDDAINDAVLVLVIKKNNNGLDWDVEKSREIQAPAFACGARVSNGLPES